jgi:uncharacterized protein (DUF427 family)
MKAIYNNQVIAKSNNTIVIEGNHYFPPDSVKKEFLTASDTHTTCPWKGEASYYNVVVNGDKVDDAAWYYPNPRPLAEEIKGYIAFWNGVEVTE